jgi:hypothetical protein
MQAHPAHLSGAIENWFGQPAIQRNAWDTSDAKDDQARRQLLAFELGDGAEYGARYRAERLLRGLHSSRLDAVAGELFNSLRPDDPARDALVALMDRTGSVPAVAAEAVQARRAAVAASTPAEPAHELPRWRPEPMPVDPIVVRFDGMDQDLRAIVALALEIVGGDVHEIYGTPGPLGAEYDEPPDLDWHSTDRNADVVRAVVGAVDRALQRDPGSWCDLRRLLAHPSQSLRLAAFERCAARCEPYDVIPLALEALEQHVRHDDTRLSGRWQGYWMAAHSGGGSGTIHVDVPDVRSKLVRAVRKRLTSAHRMLIESLAQHEVPLLRVLAATWCRDLGDPTWAAILEPLLSDVHAKIVRAALDGLEALAPEHVDAYVLRADRSRWTAAHDAEIFELQRAWSPTTLIALIDEAAARCAAVERSGVFNGCPSPVEEALQRAAWTEADAAALGSHVLRWAAHPEPRVRFACARVGVSRGILSIGPLVPLLESQDVAERVSALECITRSGETSHVGRVLEIWGDLFTKTWSPHRLHFAGPELEDRLLWALDGALVELAPLLTHVASYVPFDHAEMIYEPRGKEIVARVVSIVERWGDPGVGRLLELLDDKRVEEHHDFCELIVARARRAPDFRQHLEARAAAEKPASSHILEDLCRTERERDLDGLLETLRRDVFPRDWSALTARTPPDPALPRPTTKKHTILFLAANPSGTDRLALDREARAIQVELERSGYRDCFEFETRWAAEPLDLLRELRKLKPTVVHFSGQGGQSFHRDVVGADGSTVEEPQHGLFFHGSDGRAQLVSTQALEETFGAVGASVQLVVLSACYSEAQAEALLAHVACVVGMGGSIHHDAARSFAIGFYGGLGERESVAAAYKQGRAAISLEGLRDSDRPQLKIRAGVDAGQLVLAADPS